MSFIDDICIFFGGEDFGALGYKITLLNGNAVYIEWVKSVKSFSLEKVILRVAKKEIEIDGECLCIKKLCSGDVAVQGKIKGLSLK